jgi:hypothetical protein
VKLRSRLDRLNKRLGDRPEHGPLTVFLREAAPGLPPGRRVVWDGRAVEVVYDPAAGPPELPPGGPHKVISGVDPDWV